MILTDDLGSHPNKEVYAQFFFDLIIHVDHEIKFLNPYIGSG